METLTRNPFTAAHIERAQSLALELANALKDNDEAIFYYGDDEGINPIETECRDGFIPYTSGGFEVCLPAAISHARGTGRAPAPVQSIIDSMETDCADEWARTYPDRPGLWDCVCYWPDTHPDMLTGGETPMERAIPLAWQDEAQDWEHSWFSESDSCYYWKARIMFLAPDDRQNETGAPEVYVDAYICLDSYGRDHISWLRCYGSNPDQTRGTFKRTIPADKFAAMSDDELSALVGEAIANLP